MASPTTPSPTLSPSESPSNLPSMSSSIVHKQPTITESPITQEEEPFLFLRPLQTMQLRLVGTYNATRQDDLLDSLKRIAQDVLYDSMVDSFVLDIDSGSDIDSDNEGQENSTATTINATTNENDDDDDGARRRRRRLQQLFNGNKNNSILYKVSLEWTLTNFQVNGDPFVHILQATGTLGFTMYDFVLLHPQTIIPLQKQVMTTTTTTTTTTTSTTIPQMELALRRNDFFFQVLEFRPLDELDDHDDEEAPDVDGDGDDPNLLDTALNDSSNTNDTTAVLDDRAGDITTDNDYEHDDNDDDEPTVNHEPVSNRTIAISLIVVCTVSTLAFGIFLKYVCIKSKQIKQDRLVRSESVSANKKNHKKDKDEDDDNDNDNDKTVKTTSSPQTVSMASGAPSPLSSLPAEEEDENPSKMARNNSDGPTSVNLLQQMDAVEGTDLDVEEAKNQKGGSSNNNTGKSSKKDIFAKRIASSLRLPSFIGKDDSRSGSTSKDKEKSDPTTNAESEANDKSIAKRIGSSWSLPTFSYAVSPKGYVKADDDKVSAVSSFDYLDHEAPHRNPDDLEKGSGDELIVSKDTNEESSKNIDTTEFATSWRLPVLLKDSSTSTEEDQKASMEPPKNSVVEESTDEPNPDNSNKSESNAIDAALPTETGNPKSSEEQTADNKSTDDSNNVVERKQASKDESSSTNESANEATSNLGKQELDNDNSTEKRAET